MRETADSDNWFLRRRGALEMHPLIRLSRGGQARTTEADQTTLTAYRDRATYTNIHSDATAFSEV